MGITVEGGREVAEALRNASNEIVKAAARAVRAEAEAVADTERELVPYISGDLHDGITVRQVGALAAEVGIYDSELIYAIWIEWGRSSASAQPFATPASEQSRQRWPSRAADAVREATS